MGPINHEHFNAKQRLTKFPFGYRNLNYLFIKQSIAGIHRHIIERNSTRMHVQSPRTHFHNTHPTSSNILIIKGEQTIRSALPHSILLLSLRQ